MNKVARSLSFGQQIIPVSSDKPISPEERAGLAETKKLLDEKIGKDVVAFKIKDANNIDIVVNHPNPKIEKDIAEKLKVMAAGAFQAPAKPAAPAAPVGPKPAGAGQKLDVVA